MKSREMNILKSCFKKKIRITDAVLISILIYGNVSYSADMENNVGTIIKAKNNVIKTDDSTTQHVEDSNALNVNLNNTTTTVTNKGIIESSTNIIRNNVSSPGGSGSVLYSDLSMAKSGNAVYGSETTIKNEGIINSLTSINGGNLDLLTTNEYAGLAVGSQWSGNGIFGGKTIENIGIISGSTSLKGVTVTSKETKQGIESAPYSIGSGNGIYEGNVLNISDRVLSINNAGVIRGKNIVSGATVNNNGSSIIDSNFSGNGISVGNHSTTPSTTTSSLTINSNEGSIRGESSLEGSTINVNNTISDNSSASIYSLLSGNGIVVGQLSNPVEGTINVTKNNGIIAGKSYLKGGNLTNLSGSSTTDPENPGYSSVSSNASANGIFSNKVSIKENIGSITGESQLTGGHTTITAHEFSGTNVGVTSQTTANGIVGVKETNLDSNKGIISGSITSNEGYLTTGSVTTKQPVSIINSGNGIFGGKSINNDGTISGYASGGNLYQSGNGIFLNMDPRSTSIPNEVISKGVIKGSSNAIATATDGTVSNYGVVAGGNVYSDYEMNTLTTNNYGLEIDLKTDTNGNILIDSNGNSVIEGTNSASNGASIDNRTVMNAADSTGHADIYDKYFQVNNTTQFINNIVNGVGNESGTLTANNASQLIIDNSIINAYKTAITLNNGSSLTANNSIFNGGGLKNNDDVIESKGDSTIINLNGKSIINGNTSINGNSSVMSISNESQVNGNIESKGNNNTLQLGDEKSSGSNQLTIYKDIKGFNKIETKGSVLLSSESTIDKGNITIKDGSKLIVSLDGTSRDSNNYVIGHALYNHKGAINLEAPPKYTGPTPDIDDKDQLIFKASGLGENTVIAMNGTDVSSINDYYLGTTSIVHTARKLNDADGNVIISIKNFDDIFPNPVVPPVVPPTVTTVVTPVVTPTITPVVTTPASNKDIIEDRKYIEKTYNGIKDSKQIGALSLTTVTTDNRKDAKVEVLSLLDQTYANNPYAFVGEASKEAIDLFRVSHQYVAIPELGDYIVSGSAISSYSNYNDVTMNNVVSGQTADFKYGRDTKTYGGLGDIEYGLGNKSSVGLLVGGAKQKVNMSHNSDLDGNILYLGAYHRKEFNKFTFETGIGYQYASYDVTRNISNKYQTIKNKGDVDTNSIVIYEDIRYLLLEENGWKVEPKLNLTAVHINQDSAKEKKSDLSMDINSQTYNYFDTEVGMDITKEVVLKTGKLKTKGTLSYINSQGPSEDKISAKFSQGGEKFDILGPDLSKNNGKVGMEFTYEQPNGMEYFVGVDYKVGERKQNTTVGRIGINYTF